MVFMAVIFIGFVGLFDSASTHVFHRSHRRGGRGRGEAGEDFALLVGEELAGFAHGADEGHARFAG